MESIPGIDKEVLIFRLGGVESMESSCLFFRACLWTKSECHGIFFCIQWILVIMQYHTSYCFCYMVVPPTFHDSVQLVNLQLVDTNFSRAPYQCWVVVSNMFFISYLLGGNDPLWHIFLSNGLVQPPTRKSINHGKSPLDHHWENMFLFKSPLNQHFGTILAAVWRWWDRSSGGWRRWSAMWSFLALGGGPLSVKDVDPKKDPLRDFDDLNEQQLTNIYYYFWAHLRLALFP